MPHVRVKITRSDLHSWFKRQKFKVADFEKGHQYITTRWKEQPIRFKLTQRDGFDTFYKEAFGGSLVVFEVSLKGKELSYHGYCPIWLFGIWTLKWSFKKEAGRLFKYREEGALEEKRFLQFLAR